MLAFTRAVVLGSDPTPVTVDVWIVDLGTGAAHRLTHGSTARVGERLRAQDGYSSWSPDGSHVLYVHEEHATPAGLDQYTVMSVGADGSGPRSITPNDVNGGQPMWAPDGTLIAFQSPPDDEGVTRALYTIRPDGTGMTSLTNTLDTNDSAHPTWSPDSRYIAFSHVPAASSASSASANLYVVGRDGRDPHPIAVTAADETAPSWGRG
jgi:TolB protein